MSWQKYMTGSGGEFKVLIDITKDNPQVGFVRYAWMKKYTAYVVHEIGIAEEHQGKGYGSILLTQVPVPVLLKCNSDNEKGNSFYKSMRMNCAGLTHTKKGVEQIIWTRSAKW
jgi:hypothetical protein